jgi:hypothetical protein
VKTPFSQPGAAAVAALVLAATVSDRSTPAPDGTVERQVSAGGSLWGVAVGARR